MFTHIFLGSNDIARSKRFYDAVMGALNAQLLPHPRGWLYKSGDSALIVATPRDGEAATASNGFTLGLRALAPAMVDAFHSAGVQNGGTCEGTPGVKVESPGHMYGAYLRDPDGHKLCAFSFNRVES